MRILQLRDVADALNITPSGARWLIDTGKLPAHRTASGQRIVLEEDIERYRAERDAIAHARTEQHVA